MAIYNSFRQGKFTEEADLPVFYTLHSLLLRSVEFTLISAQLSPLAFFYYVTDYGISYPSHSVTRTHGSYSLTGPHSSALFQYWISITVLYYVYSISFYHSLL
jgi:hypothetical protein